MGKHTGFTVELLAEFVTIFNQIVTFCPLHSVWYRRIMQVYLKKGSFT